MPIFRVFHEDGIPGPGSRWRLDKGEARHLVRVRRARPGATVEAVDGRGLRASAKLVEAHGGEAILETIAVRAEAPVFPRVHLHLSLAKSKAFELVVQKATEFGVASIIPVNTANCEVDVTPARIGNKLEKWRAIAIESLKQCGNPWLPRINAPRALAEALQAKRHTSPLRLVAALLPEAEPLGEAFTEPPPEDIDAFIGPEGDFTAEEHRELLKAGCVPFTLGRTVLRVETAAVATLALIAQWGLVNEPKHPSQP